CLGGSTIHSGWPRLLAGGAMISSGAGGPFTNRSKAALRAGSDQAAIGLAHSRTRRWLIFSVVTDYGMVLLLCGICCCCLCRCLCYCCCCCRLSSRTLRRRGAVRPLLAHAG